MDPATRRQLEAERLARAAARQAQAAAVTHAEPQALGACTPRSTLTHSYGSAPASLTEPIHTARGGIHTAPVPTAEAGSDDIVPPVVRKRQRSSSADLVDTAGLPSKVARRATDQDVRARRAPSTSSSLTSAPTSDNVVVVLSSSEDEEDDDIRIVEHRPTSAAREPTQSSSAPAAVSCSARQYKVPPAVPRSTGPATMGVASSLDHGGGAQPKYLDGRFFMTAVGSTASSSAQHATIRFSDLVDKSHITAAILSSYVWEEAWLLPHFPADTRFCFVNNAKSPIQLPPTLAATSRIVTPTLNSGGAYGCMHTKLCLLVYPGFIRFVLGSANLIGYDWTGMANVIYVHDFPRCTATSPPNATAFYDTELAPLLRDLGVPEGIHKIVGQCDSSSFVNLGRRLVRSRPGSYLPGDGYGLAGMVDAAKTYGLAKDVGLVVTCATSSVGSLDHEYLRLWGDGIVRGQYVPVQGAPTTEVRIVYPTCNEVANGVYGVEGGRSLWLRKSLWDTPGFPKDKFWTLDAKAKGYLSHAKTIVVLPKNPSSTPVDGDKPIGLYYTGSHNFTRAAWGSLTKREAKCRMSNYETGIVCPITRADQVGRELPVAYGAGSHKYDLSKTPEKGGDVPWMQELFLGP